MVDVELERVSVSFAYLKYGKVDTVRPYESLLMHVSDGNGVKQDWNLAKDIREIDILEKMVKDGKAKKFKVTEKEMKVPVSVPLEFAGIVKNRVGFEGFLEGSVYVTDIDVEKDKVIKEDKKNIENNKDRTSDNK